MILRLFQGAGTKTYRYSIYKTENNKSGEQDLQQQQPKQAYLSLINIRQNCVKVELAP
jgi:hypothetical protein